MAEFNPDLLLKDELCYEALLRGLKHVNVTVSELRKSLRLTGSETVSYTHLDVYKRQSLPSAHTYLRFSCLFNLKFF